MTLGQRARLALLLAVGSSVPAACAPKQRTSGDEAHGGSVGEHDGGGTVPSGGRGAGGSNGSGGSGAALGSSSGGESGSGGSAAAFAHQACYVELDQRCHQTLAADLSPEDLGTVIYESCLVQDGQLLATCPTGGRVGCCTQTTTTLIDNITSTNIECTYEGSVLADTAQANCAGQWTP